MRSATVALSMSCLRRSRAIDRSSAPIRPPSLSACTVLGASLRANRTATHQSPRARYGAALCSLTNRQLCAAERIAIATAIVPIDATLQPTRGALPPGGRVPWDGKIELAMHTGERRPIPRATAPACVHVLLSGSSH